ncbi:MAG: hypothetical protein C0404_02195 [Verrucomicrobia bacterium]|nr:hypothetical protein [Verrucomicrobiota bacterium]
MNTLGRKIMRIGLALLAVAAVLAIVYRVHPDAAMTVTGKKTVADRLAEYGVAARNRLEPDFRSLGIAYPPKALILVGLKQEKFLEAWASADGSSFKLLKKYPIRAMSGKSGPKLMQGDMQAPEGLYMIESLNPNSLYHLSLRLNYPNDFDRRMAAVDGRANLGGDIMIHGEAVSIGCLAIGNEPVEELFVLAADMGEKNIKVIMTPVDFRIRQLPADAPPAPAWTNDLYAAIRASLEPLK